ncbi:RNA polymerase sigma-70 factor (ECF subfamily) [Prosthecobacter fusiformis]|uniref:RNA polymerase sigma-70 factor (ECF subfamily) n=1 Tax=Prosthecobacter fusiformis TaxID=48464 RepID=A0A4R7RLA8_9BACT|nr:sigma-70 family RNA polymerase sigma factor [Prosthecobacter fusiformis]TDU64233.1 RNA polymerase sigma-70 factor (ECF subfamily) [Prosthecobacter fusiformis]
MSPLEVTDESLLQRAGGGDARAFEQLYDRFSSRLLGLLRQMLGDEREAEDVLQEGFLYLWDHAGSYDPSRSRAFTWSVMIFRHKAIDRIRAMGRRARLNESAAVEMAVLEDCAVGADDTVEMKEQQKQVYSALASLPGEQRKLIEFAFLKGLTHHAIAESLNLPLGTVKTNIRRGLLKLRDLMKGGAL